MKSHLFVGISLSVVLASRPPLPLPPKCLTNYESYRIYRGSRVDQLQPVAGDLAEVPTLPHSSIPLKKVSPDYAVIRFIFGGWLAPCAAWLGAKRARLVTEEEG
jgi:hypothetical protein